MTRSAYWIGFLLCCSFLGCGVSAPSPTASSTPTSTQIHSAPNSGTGESPASSPRKIIFTAQVDVVVEDMTIAQQRLSTLIEGVQKVGGYVAHQEVQGTAGAQRRGTWTVRAPLYEFDRLMADLEQLGDLQRSSRDAQDVTEAYTDLEARLRNKQSSEQRLLSHLEKTGELKDTLEVERELSRVRGEVEQLQGQLNLLKNKTDLATIIITLQERLGYTPATTPNFTTQASRTFDGSWQAFRAFLRFLALLLVATVPWLCVAVPILGAIWFWKRRRRATNRP